MKYFEFFWCWVPCVNFVLVSMLKDAFQWYVFDSLFLLLFDVVRYVEGPGADVGSGVGFLGILFVIVCSDIEWMFIEL